MSEIIILYLEPSDVCIGSRHFTFKSNLLLLRNADIHYRFGDHSRGFCRSSTFYSESDYNLLVSQGSIRTKQRQNIPETISLHDVRTPSARKEIVPASSLLRFDSVRACFIPRAVIRQFDPNFNLAPSLVHEPSTSA